MNPKTRIRSYFMRFASSAPYQTRLRARARKQRIKTGSAPVVHYFHQVDDPYSHLAVQKFDQLSEQYSLKFEPHLVSSSDPAYQGSKDHFARWAHQDAASIAGAYGVSFPTANAQTGVLAKEQTARANQLLAAHLAEPDFAKTASQVGEALWQEQPLPAAHTNPTSSPQSAERALQSGNALREKQGHYQGGMFYFEGEWFWGIDRIRLLEERLLEEGFAESNASICVPEPTPTDTTSLDASQVVLEYFPSLRSPYTAIGHQRVVDLVTRSGVNLQVRPVMPMLMRGIPAPQPKQRYIITDAGREGRAHGAPLGRIVDPFGEPVKRAFALFPGAQALDQAMDFVTAYLNAAWFDGVNITTNKGLRQVANNANMDWQALIQATQGTDWEAILDANLNELLGENLWGVPSFRVSGGNDASAFACWGQDRIWRIENEIAARSQNQ